MKILDLSQYKHCKQFDMTGFLLSNRIVNIFIWLYTSQFGEGINVHKATGS